MSLLLLAGCPTVSQLLTCVSVVVGRLSVGSSMKRDTRCVVGIGTEHPQIMEEAK